MGVSTQPLTHFMFINPSAVHHIYMRTGIVNVGTYTGDIGRATRRTLIASTRAAAEGMYGAGLVETP